MKIKELTGIWVAKFEAGFASGNNTATPTYSSKLKYSQKNAWGGGAERTENKDGNVTARNWLQGEYGETETFISYPVFMGTTYSMNYINHNDAFLLCKEISKSGNTYKLDTAADSHMMKDSEWGAVVYLSKSKYGLGSTDIFVNNLSLNSNGGNRTETAETAETAGVESVYAVTGVTGGDSTTGAIRIKTGEGQNTITALNASKANTAVEVTKTDNTQANMYTWDQQTGTGASTTGNIYGIYDMSGGLWERTAAYTNNGRGNLTNYGGSLVTDNGDAATKYTMVYPHDTSADNTSIKDEAGKSDKLNAASAANWTKNTRIFGNAIRETSTAGTDTNSWYGDCSIFVGLDSMFSMRGGYWSERVSAGLFYFGRTDGTSCFIGGFRAVLVGC